LQRKNKLVALSLFLLLLGFVLACYGGIRYNNASRITSENIPSGGIDIWAGPTTPHELANVSGTLFTVSLVDDTVTVEVYFGFPQYQTMHFWTTIPFRAFDMSTWVDRNGRYKQGDTSIGIIKSSYNVSANGATIANASFTPLVNIPYFNVTVGLAIMFHVQGLIAKTNGATDNIILTFAGQPLWGNDAWMEHYMIPDTQPVWKYPLLVQIQFPSDAFFSSETFPSPVAYYATSGYRIVSFGVNFYALDFIASGSLLAQTISFSFVHPEIERQIQQNLFSGGLFLGFGIPTILSGSYELAKELLGDDEKCDDKNIRDSVT
jgi:hypothetical protein